MKNKFCKDCRHFQEVAKSDKRIDTGSRCAAPLPDIIMGNDPFKMTDNAGTGCNSAYNMRVCGPCGLEGHLFEPKEQGFV
jgi:hypothetical protein